MNENQKTRLITAVRDLLDLMRQGKWTPAQLQETLGALHYEVESVRRAVLADLTEEQTAA